MAENKFNYSQAKLESVSCNLCGADDFFVLARKSANNLPARTCLCKNCGLIYISPRLTKEEYDNYYKYYYREDRAIIKGKKPGNAGNGFESSKIFGRALAHGLRGYFASGPTLDVGSSTGGILAGLKEVLPELEVMGIEPSLAEAEFANKQGIKTYNCLFEDFQDEKVGSFSNIICVQSLNHLLDPRQFFSWSYGKLRPGGHLILAVKNFRHQVRRSGRLEAGVQIDHPFMFTPESLRLFVESAGFKTVYLDVDEYKTKSELAKQREKGMSVHHIRLAAVKPFTGQSQKNEIKEKGIYRKLRWQFFRPFIKIYYYLFCANKVRFLKNKLKIFH